MWVKDSILLEHKIIFIIRMEKKSNLFNLLEWEGVILNYIIYN